jgi:hypothetical protein
MAEIGGGGGPFHRLYTFPVLDAVDSFFTKRSTAMKKVALALAAVLGLMSMAGCAQDYIGKRARPHRRSLPRAK